MSFLREPSYPRLEKVKVDQLNDGDHIAVEGHCSDLPFSRIICPTMGYTNGKYFHHGIFDGKRLEVIDFHGETQDKNNARMKRRLIGEFAHKGRKLYRVVHKKCLPVEETMKRAERVLNAKKGFPAYNLLFNNCENVATFLKTGDSHSKQVSDAMNWNLRKYWPVFAVAGVIIIIGSGVNAFM